MIALNLRRRKDASRDKLVLRRLEQLHAAIVETQQLDASRASDARERLAELREERVSQQ